VSKAALASLSRCLAVEERPHGIRVSTLTLGAVNTSLWDSETVDSSFDRRAMLDQEQAADALLYLAQQPAIQVVEDLTLMPAAGAL
jgi:short-subunit dehydrogenase